MNTRLIPILVAALAAATAAADMPSKSNELGMAVHLRSNGRVQMFVSADSQQQLTGILTTNEPLRNARVTVYADSDVTHAAVTNMFHSLSRMGVTLLRLSSSTEMFPDVTALASSGPISTQEELPPDATNVIRITESEVLFNGMVSSSEQIVAWITAQSARRHQFFLVKCAPGARHESLVEILDALAVSTCERISVVAESDAEETRGE